MVEAKLKVMGVALRMAGGYFYVDRGGTGSGNVVDVRRLPCFGMSGRCSIFSMWVVVMVRHVWLDML